MSRRTEAQEPFLTERAVPGLHAAVMDLIRSRLRPGLRAVDLGTGSGAFAARLESYGCEVIACDIDASAYGGRSVFKQIDIEGPKLAETLGTRRYDVVSAVEVVEHLEAPMSFLRSVRSLVHPQGFVILTTPNVDSLQSKVKFLLKGTLRMFDEWGDPTHISPIFWDLLVRKYLPLSGLALAEHVVYPTDGFVAGRPLYRELQSVLRPLLRRNRLAGDSHILVLVPV